MSKEKDFINFFRSASQHLEKKTKPSKKNQKKQIDQTKDLINKYRAEYANVDLDVLRNMIELKDITSQEKTDTPDQSFSAIEQRLGTDESGETLRQERWGKEVKCPACGSTDIKKLSAKQQKTAYIYRYQCNSCNEKFNDDSDTAMESGVPALYTWMMCWYLYGCTNSLQYIATKLGIDVATVELMIEYMQKLFKAKQPLTNFLTFDEWSLRYGKSYQQAMQQNLNKKEVLFKGDTAKTPTDTAEYRRQKNRGPNPKAPKPRS